MAIVLDCLDEGAGDRFVWSRDEGKKDLHERGGEVDPSFNGFAHQGLYLSYP
jgi:hypothetical protein